MYMYIHSSAPGMHNYSPHYLLLPYLCNHTYKYMYVVHRKVSSECVKSMGGGYMVVATCGSGKW